MTEAGAGRAEQADAPPPTPAGSRLGLVQLAGIALGLVMVAAVVVLSNPGRVLDSLRQVGAGPLAAALALNVAVVGLRAWRADTILRHLGYRVPMARMLGVQLVGQTASALTPAAGGDLVRAWLWRRDQDVPLSAGTATVVFERLFSFALLVALGVLLLALPRHGVAGWLGVAAALAILTVLPALFARRSVSPDGRIARTIARLPWLRSTGERALRVLAQMQSIVGSKGVLIRSSGATLAIYALSGVQILLLVTGLGHPMPVTQAVATYCVSQVGGILSSLPFGLGPADLLTVGALARYGVDVSLAATVAILLRAVTSVPLALAALPAYIALRGGAAAPDVRPASSAAD